MYFLGVDGGGTKTQIILSDEKANILGISVVGPTLVNVTPADVIGKTLEAGIEATVSSTGLKKVRISKACFGMAGLDTPYDFEVLSKIIKGLKVNLGPSPILINDTPCALRRGTDKGFGIAIVAGTGSNGYGRSRFGREAFVSGLGHILSDEGGSYYIGEKVLHASAKSYDGRIEKSFLEDMVCEHFGVINIRDLLSKISKEDFSKKDIAALSVVCEDASERGDLTAHEILEGAGRELALMVKTIAQKLKMEDDSFDLVCIGGSFKRPHGPIRKTFEKYLKRVVRIVNFVSPTNEPAMGAVLIAIDKASKFRKHG